jgi:thiol-disulfide isomerase/thioredoxin
LNKLFFIFVVLFSLSYTSHSLVACPCKVDDPNVKLQVRDKVDLTSIEFFNGERLSPNSLNESKIGILFWASWCKLCRDELENVDFISKVFSSNHIHLIGVSLDFDKESGIDFIKKRNINFPNAFISFEILDTFKEIKTLPMLIIVDKSGNVLSISNPLTVKQIETTISELGY